MPCWKVLSDTSWKPPKGQQEEVCTSGAVGAATPTSTCTCYPLSTALGPHWPHPPTTQPQVLTQSVVGVGEVSIGLFGDLAGDASLDKRHWKELLLVIIVVHSTAPPITAEHTAAYVILWGWGKGWGTGWGKGWGTGQGDNTMFGVS